MKKLEILGLVLLATGLICMGITVFVTDGEVTDVYERCYACTNETSSYLCHCSEVVKTERPNADLPLLIVGGVAIVSSLIINWYRKRRTRKNETF